MRTTLNISDKIIAEAEALYNTTNRSKAVEMAIIDAIRIKKFEKLKNLKGKISFDEDSIKDFRGLAAVNENI